MEMPKTHRKYTYSSNSTKNLHSQGNPPKTSIFMEIPQKQKVDPSFEFDTPVPPKKSHNQATHRTSEESIGDLAPHSLK